MVAPWTSTQPNQAFATGVYVYPDRAFGDWSVDLILEGQCRLIVARGEPSQEVAADFGVRVGAVLDQQVWVATKMDSGLLEWNLRS
jgi:hypothetical protein